VVIFVRSIPVFKHIKTQEARYQTRVGTKANCAEKLS